MRWYDVTKQCTARLDTASCGALVYIDHKDIPIFILDLAGITWMGSYADGKEYKVEVDLKTMSGVGRFRIYQMK